jgi:hypothetical protein
MYILERANHICVCDLVLMSLYMLKVEKHLRLTMTFYDCKKKYS